MKSKAAINGHPIHPMIIAFPVTLLSASVLSDILYIARVNSFWYDVSYYSMLAGIITGLIAAVPGLIDYLGMEMPDRTRSVATTHMVLNLTVMTLFIISLYFRSGDTPIAGTPITGVFSLSLVGFILLCVSGWLGGNLAYKHGLGVESRIVGTPEEIASPLDMDFGTRDHDRGRTLRPAHK